MMVSRNQIRKLWPDLIDSFKLYKEANSNTDNCYLYLHTTWPDGGYDIDDAIVKSGISDNILVTYICRECKSVFAFKYKGVSTTCIHCGGNKVMMPSVSNSLNRKELANVMNLADLGILVAIGEGWGMSLSEFKKLGIPVTSIKWSAMEEQVHNIECGEDRHLGGISMEASRLFVESATQQKRSLFSKQELANIIKDVFSSTSSEWYKNKCIDAKKCAKEYFNWDRVGKIWDNAIEGVDVSTNLQTEFFSSVRMPPLNKDEIPDEIKSNVEAAVRFCVAKWCRIPYFTEYRINEIIYSIKSGKNMIDSFNKMNYTFDDFFNMITNMINEHNSTYAKINEE